jgi:hypothetical protein
MSVIESMPAFHRSGRETQPRFWLEAARETCSRRRTRQHIPLSGIEGRALAVLPPQLVQQPLELRRQTGRFGSQILSQPFSDRLADRRAGGTVDLLVSVDISVGHCRSRFAFISMRSHQMITPNQVRQHQIVSDFVADMPFR